MSRRVVLLGGFVCAAALLGGALVWISKTALALEAGQAEARRRADLEERARLALWRMDAAVATLLSQENTAPLEWRDAAPSGLVRLRFEIDARGKTRLALARTLEAEVRDLLPQASVEPVRFPAASDPGRQLALLPLKLAPGELPAGPSVGWSPARIGLALSSATIVVVLAATGLLLLGSLRLARRRADFVSAVTHELRTPLTTFRLYTEMLSDDMVPVPDRPTYLATLRHESERLSHLVENVLAFSRLERRKSEPQLEEVELGRFLEDVQPRLERTVEGAGLTLTGARLTPEQSGVRVRIDRVAGERILQNLIDNACKYGRGGERPEVELSGELRGRQAVLTVRDYGPGLSPGDRRRIFRPFHKSAARAAATAPGVGLGLALSRRLARSFGGDLRCAEPQGRGAAFELWLPVG